jgi:hypothetical protein
MENVNVMNFSVQELRDALAKKESALSQTPVSHAERMASELSKIGTTKLDVTIGGFRVRAESVQAHKEALADKANKRKARKAKELDALVQARAEALIASKASKASKTTK